MFEVFLRFLLLGCMSFGGPIAHIGYFQREFVNKRKWLNDNNFASALSLCQFLPGPASSQLGMYIGYQRAGYLGALAAFIGFTFPSFTILTFAAIYSAQLQDSSSLILLITAAKLLAVVVVADAIWTMATKFISDTVTLIVCVISASWVLTQSGLLSQLIPIIVSGILGWVFFKKSNNAITTSSSQINNHSKAPLLLFGIFLFLLILPWFFSSKSIELFHHFYQAGSFVFGGGHVVLPLLEPLVGKNISANALVEGYAAAQLVPGPMFTIASFLGASSLDITPVLGSAIATIAIFLPGGLLLFAALPYWQNLMQNQGFSASVKLINAAVVGLLVAAFYQPVLISAIDHYADILICISGLVIIRKFNYSLFSLLVLMLIYSAMKTYIL